MRKERTSRIGRLLGRTFRIRSWIDYDRIKAFLIYLVSGTKKLTEPATATEKRASFAAAAKELSLSEAALRKKERALLMWSRLMCVVALGILIWAFYHGISGHYRASLISLIVMCVALGLAFRYHFWYFQIKSRKLGCTFNEWVKYGLIGEKR